MEHLSVQQSDFSGNFQYKPKSLWRRLFGAVAVGLVVGVLLLIDIYPYRPATVLGWGLFFGFAVPAVIAFEVLEDYIMTTSFAQRFSEGGRLLLGLVFVVLVLGIALALLEYAQPSLIKWG